MKKQGSSGIRILLSKGARWWGNPTLSCSFISRNILIKLILFSAFIGTLTGPGGVTYRKQVALFQIFIRTTVNTEHDLIFHIMITGRFPASGAKNFRLIIHTSHYYLALFIVPWNGISNLQPEFGSSPKIIFIAKCYTITENVLDFLLHRSGITKKIVHS